jgi:hypothetical protein
MMVPAVESIELRRVTSERLAASWLRPLAFCFCRALKPQNGGGLA